MEGGRRQFNHPNHPFTPYIHTYLDRGEGKVMEGRRRQFNHPFTPYIHTNLEDLARCVPSPEDGIH